MFLSMNPPERNSIFLPDGYQPSIFNIPSK